VDIFQKKDGIKSPYFVLLAIFLVTGLVQLASGQAETIYVAAEICNIVQIDLTAATFWAGT
jgi:hypothetical protein